MKMSRGSAEVARHEQVSFAAATSIQMDFIASKCGNCGEDIFEPSRRGCWIVGTPNCLADRYPGSTCRHDGGQVGFIDTTDREERQRHLLMDRPYQVRAYMVVE